MREYRPWRPVRSIARRHDTTRACAINPRRFLSTVVGVMFQIKQGCAGCCPDCKQNQNCPCSRASSCREPWSRFALRLLFARFAWFEISCVRSVPTTKINSSIKNFGTTTQAAHSLIFWTRCDIATGRKRPCAWVQKTACSALILIN